MWLEIKNLNTTVVRANDEEKDWLFEYLSFEDPRAHFAHRKDNKVRMYNLVSGTFATGFLSMVRKAATEEGFNIEIMDKRVVPGLPDPGADLAWLMPYQLECVQRALMKDRGIIWSPTGSGKTEIFTALAKSLQVPWLFVVHKINLVYQAAERFERRTGEKAGIIGEGNWDTKRVTCATFQTLHARLDDPECLSFLDGVKALMVDEGHTLPADSFRSVVMKTRQAYYRYAMSGTPLARGDRRSILVISATGPVIYRIKSRVLIEAGILAKPKIRMIPVVQSSDKPTWQGVYGECIVRSTKRNKAVVFAALRAAKPCLVFVKEIKHGELLLKMLLKAGVKAEFVWGSHSNQRRMAAVKRLVRTDIDVLVCSTIFNEGVDIPALASVVIASGGKSVIEAIQRVGRGMRTDGGRKTEFEVWDFEDRGNKWLDRHTRKRRRAYQSEEYEVVVDEMLGQQAAL